jgi:hypothetical protein
MAKSKSPFMGRWQIVSMDAWDVDDEEPAYFEFDAHGGGHFQFATVQGVMDCRLTTRGKEPAVEWTWEGGDEDKPATGRGWAVLRGDQLHGMIVIHDADESGFVAKRTKSSVQSEAAFRELVRVLEEAVQAGADSLGMEYENRKLIVYFNFGNTGLGAARIAQELEQPVIRELVKQAGLSRKREGVMQVKLLGQDYDMQVEQYEDFGESAFRLRLKQKRKKAGGPTLLALNKPTAKKAADAPEKPGDSGKVRIYTLAVFLPRRPLSNTFSKTKSRVYRTIQIRGDQTLEDLHHAIFSAFDREEEHLYEFQLGKGPKDRQGPIYGLLDTGGDKEGLVTETTIDSLRLKAGRSFGYLFDFGDNWQHQINVEAVEDTVPKGHFPRVTKRVGESPPQYPDQDE